jgi:hypothetical protein
MGYIRAFFDSNVVRTLLAIIAIGVSIAIYRLNKRKKALSYEITSFDKLFHAPSLLKERVQIIVDGKVANDINLAIIEIQNTGNEPIKREDFDSPLKFSFIGEGEILSSRILSTKPADLDAVINAEPSSLSLQPLLLNSNDRVRLEVLTSTAKYKIQHSARIVGISEIKSSLAKHRRNQSRDWIFVASLFALVLVFQIGNHMGIERWLDSHERIVNAVITTPIMLIIGYQTVRLVRDR